MFLSVQEFMTFTSQLIVERSAKGSRASVKEQGKRTSQPGGAGSQHDLHAPLRQLVPNTPFLCTQESACCWHLSCLVQSLDSLKMKGAIATPPAPPPEVWTFQKRLFSAGTVEVIL